MFQHLQDTLLGNCRMNMGMMFRRWWWLFTIPVVLFALARIGSSLLDRKVKQRLEELGNRVAGPGYLFTIDRVDAHLLSGGIDVYGISLTYDTALWDSLRNGELGEVLEVHATRLRVRQVSYWQLLRQGEAHFRTIEVDTPELAYHFKPEQGDDVADEVVDEEAMTELPALIAVDTLLVLGATGYTTDITGKRPSLHLGECDIRAYTVRLRTQESGRMTYWVAGADIAARGMSAELPPLYDVRLGSLQVDHPAGTAILKDIRLEPREGPDSYGKVIEHETDLLDLTLDSLRFEHIEVGRFITDQILHMGRMTLHAPHARIHRDKTMPDGPFVRKNLPVSGLRQLGISLRIDTVVVENGTVEYHERDANSPEYGVVSFSDIHGEMYGLNNSREPDSTSHLVVHAQARLYERTRVKVHYKAAMASTTDAFTIDARLEELPFTVFNRMTDDLLQVQATKGTIYSLHLRMQGNEWQSSGTLDLAYEDLHIDLVPKAQKWHQGIIKNLLGNALVRKSNLPDRRNYRQGSFVVDRRKDRAVFNYIWRAVKAGTVDTMAPGLLRKPIKQAAS
jgi:hypothetical protein